MQSLSLRRLLFLLKSCLVASGSEASAFTTSDLRGARKARKKTQRAIDITWHRSAAVGARHVPHGEWMRSETGLRQLAPPPKAMDWAFRPIQASIGQSPLDAQSEALERFRRLSRRRKVLPSLVRAFEEG